MSKEIRDITDNFYKTVNRWEAMDEKSKEAIINEFLSQIKKVVEGMKYPVIRNYVARKAEWLEGYNKAIDDVKELFT